MEHYFYYSKQSSITSVRSNTFLDLNIQNLHIPQKITEPLRYSFSNLSSNHHIDLVICVGIIVSEVSFIHSSFYPCSVVISKTGTGLGHEFCFDKKHVCKYDARRILKDICVFVPLHHQEKVLSGLPCCRMRPREKNCIALVIPANAILRPSNS